MGDGAPQHERDRAVDEALHHDLPRVGADRRGGEPRGEQRQRERERRAGAHERLEPRVRALDRVDAGAARVVEDGCRDDEHRHVDDAGDPHRDDDVDLAEVEQPAALAVVARLEAILDERRVQVDDVRHHGRAEDPRREQDAVRPREPGHEARRARKLR